MANYFATNKLLNIKETQQHPFHVLTSSKLPIITATLSGILAVTFVAKLHNISAENMYDFSLVTGLVLDPLFSVASLSSVSANLTILNLLFLLVGVM